MHVRTEVPAELRAKAGTYLLINIIFTHFYEIHPGAPSFGSSDHVRKVAPADIGRGPG